jgi:hypothetical protein
MENTNRTQPTEVSRVAVRLPQFSLAGVTDERTKFYHVLSQLDQRFANEVADVITTPSQHHSYTRLKGKSSCSHRQVQVGISPADPKLRIIQVVYLLCESIKVHIICSTSSICVVQQPYHIKAPTHW